jgi:hypothetical protein
VKVEDLQVVALQHKGNCVYRRLRCHSII